MKKTLFTLILMFLCVAMVMTSCDLFKNDDQSTGEVDSPEVAADKATIISAISGTKLGDVFADIEEVAAPDMDEVTEAIEALKAQADITISDVGDVKGIISDGNALIYVGAEGEYMLGAAIAIAGDQLVAISQSEYGYSVSLSGAMPEVDDAEITATMEQIEHYVDIIDGITIPSLTSSLITKNGDWYMLNREFTKNLIKSYIVGIATAEGAEINEEALASLDEELANITVDLGFAVSGDKIHGVKADVAVVTETVSTTPDEGNTPASSTTTQQVAKFGFEALLTADLTALDRVAASYGVGENSVAAVIDVDMTAEELKAVAVDFDYVTETEAIDAKAYVNFADFTKANATVATLDVDIDIKDINTHSAIEASIKNNADGNGVIDFKAIQDGEVLGTVTGTLDYDNAPDAPAANDFVFTLVNNAEAFEAKGQELLEAYIAYVTTNTDATKYPTVVYYDAELDVTIVCSLYVYGSYESIYDENGEFVGENFTPNTFDSDVNVYILEGNATPESYDFTLTVVEGEYVFTVHENTNTDANGDINVGVDEDNSDAE